MERDDHPRWTVLICLLLAAMTLAAYWPVFRNSFVNYDDPVYVTENPHVLGGLSRASIAWAFRTSLAGNWHPLTCLSHILDVQLFGLKPAGHHLTSLLLHAANAVLLFLVLRRMTRDGGLNRSPQTTVHGPQSTVRSPQSSRVTRHPSPVTLWPSFVVAGLFALHPLHVESVAWVAERKDLLSGFFFMLTLWAYARYAQMPNDECRMTKEGRMTNDECVVSDVGCSMLDVRCWMFGVHGSKRFLWYLLSLLLFALGLMSKPMLVTLPFVLLLLDYWPLKRMQNAECRMQNAEPGSTQHAAPHLRPAPLLRLVVEKVPFLALATVSCVVTFLAQQQVGAVHSLEALPLGFRVANAVISYVRYPAMMLWPGGLAVLYPAPAAWPLEEVLGAALLLAGVTAFVLWQLKRAPYLAVGWFWYLGMLAPVIGIVQVGNQAMADRYMYLPLIGLLIMVVWSAAEIPARGPVARCWIAAGGLAALAACAVLTWQQLAFWRSSVPLFEHALAVTRRNVVAHNNLGTCLLGVGNVTGANSHFAEAVRLRPGYQDALLNLGLCREKQGQTNDALELVERAAQIRPNPEAEYNLGRLLSQQGRLAEAESHLQSALKLQPEFAEAWCNLGVLHAKQGRPEAAAQDYTEALQLKPDSAQAHLLLGTLLGGQQKYDEAIAQFDAVLRADPGNADAHYNIGFVLNGRRDFAGAAAHFAEAARLHPGDLDVRQDLGLALFFQGKLPEAAAQFEAVLRARPSAAAHYDLALALDGQGRAEGAATHYREAIRLEPKAPLYQNDLAWLLATSPRDQTRNGAEAVRLAEEACRLSGGKVARFWGTLDAAYAEAGRFEEAIATATKTRELALAAGQLDIAKAAEERMVLYRLRKPYRLRTMSAVAP
jgi:tetratricopeptide (TPR) repeat protein